MPNQANFRSDITTQTAPRFSASRIVKVPTEPIFLEEIPASFGYDDEDNLEIHFYTIPGNQLLLSTTVVINDQIFKSHIVEYADGTYKNYIRIDFTKLFIDKNLVLIPGDYKMVLNFFSDEIGNYNNRILTIDAISPSRTEVQLTFNNTTDAPTRTENKQLAKEFVEPSFVKRDAIGVAEKIFKSGVELNDSTEGVTAETVVDNITIPEENQTYLNTIARIDRLNLRNSFDVELNNFLVELYSFIREEIVINEDERVQQSDYEELIRSIVAAKIGRLQSKLDSRIQIS